MDQCTTLRDACTAFRRREYQKALDLLLKSNISSTETGFGSTLLKRINHNIAICKAYLESRVDLDAIQGLVDRKGKTKSPSFTYCSRLNTCTILFHQQRYIDAISILGPVIEYPNVYYVRSLLLVFECNVRMGNLNDAGLMLEKLKDLSHYLLPRGWSENRSLIFRLLESRLTNHVNSIPVIIIPELVSIQQLSLVFNMIHSMDDPVKASQYVTKLRSLIVYIPTALKPYYEATIYHYLFLLNKRMGCIAASEVYHCKSVELQEKFQQTGFHLPT